MADNEVSLGLNLDVSKVQKALYDMIGTFTGTGKDFDRVSGQIEKSFKNLEATVKRFGATSQEAEAAAKNYQKALTSLVANGIDPASAHFKTLENAVNTTNTSLGNVKKTNQSWTNLALVVQDLPYGFRGIQNNLPALFGSIATGTGAAYFAFSAIVSAITAWNMGLFDVKKNTDAAKEAQDSYNESLKQSMSSAYGDISAIKALISVIENQGISIDKRRAALKKLQDEYPAYFKNMSVEKTSISELETATNNLTSAIIARAEASAMSSEIEKIAAKRYDNVRAIEKNELAITNMTNSLELLSRTEEKHQSQYGTISRTKSPYDVQLGKIKELEKANSELRTSNESLGNSIAQLQNSINFRAPVTIGLDTKAEPQKKKDVKAKQEIFNILSYTKDYYQAKMNYADGDLEKQKQILKEEGDAYLSLFGLKIISDIEYAKQSSEVFKKLSDIRQNEEKELYKQQVYFADQRIKNVETELKVQLKLHKNNLVAQENDIKEAMAKIAILATTSMNPQAILDFIAAFDKLQAQLDGLGDQWLKFDEQFTSLVKGTFESLAIAVGEAFASGDFQKSLDGFVLILADALISIGKLAIQAGITIDAIKTALKGLGGVGAVIAGIALVGIGTVVKNSISKKASAFADGGIVSGPTMGLVGEYPGAKHNPEVIAPLDKLKSLMGGNAGSGEFVLRGNDLVLALQRSNSSLTLRRG